MNLRHGQVGVRPHGQWSVRVARISRLLSAVCLLAVAPLLSLAQSTAQGATLSLPEAISQALAQSPHQLSQRLEVERTGAGVAAARAARSATFDATGSATRYGYPTFVHSIREAGVFPSLDTTIVDLGLALKLPLYTGGKLTQGIVLADLGQQIARERERLGAQELTFNVSSVYFKIQQLDALAQVYAARIASLEAQLKRATLLRDTGKTGKLDQLKIGTLLTKARHDRLQIENRGREAWSLLYQLSGMTRPPQAPALTRYVAAWAPDSSLEQMRQQAHAQRPELQIAARQSSAGMAKEEIARAEQRPAVSLVSGVRGRSGSSGRVYDDWSVGVQLSIPLFDGGVRRARVDEAAIERRQADLAAEQTRLEVDKQIEDAWSAHVEAESRLRVTATSIAEASEALAIENLKQEQGVGLVTDVLNAETTLLGAQADRLQAQFDLITTRFGLLRATGALRPESVATLVAPDTGAASANPNAERDKR